MRNIPLAHADKIISCLGFHLSCRLSLNNVGGTRIAFMVRVFPHYIIPYLAALFHLDIFVSTFRLIYQALSSGLSLIGGKVLDSEAKNNDGIYNIGLVRSHLYPQIYLPSFISRFPRTCLPFLHGKVGIPAYYLVLIPSSFAIVKH